MENGTNTTFSDQISNELNMDEFENEVRAIVSRHRSAYGGLIGILQEVQAKHLYLPARALEIISEETGRSLTDVYGAATFYSSFSLEPRGRHLVSVCQGTACHVRGSSAIVEQMKKKLGIDPGQTTDDREFSLETVNCLGACALGPVVVVDGNYHSAVTPNTCQDIIENARNGTEHKIDDPRVFPLDLACPQCNHKLRDPSYLIDGNPAIRVTVSFGRKHGWVRMSALYGSYTIESEYEIPENTVVNFFCPHCHAELIGAVRCIECDAPMVPLMLVGGGTLQICTRRGCQAHILNLGVMPMS